MDKHQIRQWLFAVIVAVITYGFPEVQLVKIVVASCYCDLQGIACRAEGPAWRYACTLKLLSPGYPNGACDANSRPDKKLVTIMSLPVRSCLCRRHSERFGGPFGPRQWLRLLRRSTCSKRGSVRTFGSFFLVVVHYHSWLNSVEKAPDQRRHAWSVSSEHPGTCTTHSTKEHDESSVKLQSQPFVVPINAAPGRGRVVTQSPHECNSIEARQGEDREWEPSYGSWVFQDSSIRGLDRRHVGHHTGRRGLHRSGRDKSVGRGSGSNGMHMVNFRLKDACGGYPGEGKHETES
ncbi:Uncharacterized protein DBV15_08928 [Temnothorax longispinosus]|uniref:Uncharacterized protein n=1 Tax=Temnothorax longispinosus TaxID=300112 RepID=A0A4V6RG15_9HYME|nr:Uncharacterized protein DBV15_08928 [Temnothorax longispinosus]